MTAQKKNNANNDKQNQQVLAVPLARDDLGVCTWRSTPTCTSLSFLRRQNPNLSRCDKELK